jgi:hypothetical protein
VFFSGIVLSHMSVHSLSFSLSFFLAAPAFLGFVLALACIAGAGEGAAGPGTEPARALPEPSGRGAGKGAGKGCGWRLCGGGCALAAFLFIPPGALPALYDMAWGGIASLGLLGAGLACTRAGAVDSQSGRPATPPVSAWAMLAASCPPLAAYAEARGLPGEIFSLGMFSSFPLWEIAGGWGRAGLVCLLLAIVRKAGALRASVRGNLAGRVWALGFSAVIVCLFFPWSLAGHAAALTFPLAAADFCLFWIKVLLLFFYGFPLAQRLAMPPWPVLWLGGAAGLYADIILGPPVPLPSFS